MSGTTVITTAAAPWDFNIDSGAVAKMLQSHIIRFYNMKWKFFSFMIWTEDKKMRCYAV